MLSLSKHNPSVYLTSCCASASNPWLLPQIRSDWASWQRCHVLGTSREDWVCAYVVCMQANHMNCIGRQTLRTWICHRENQPSQRTLPLACYDLFVWPYSCSYSPGRRSIPPAAIAEMVLTWNYGDQSFKATWLQDWHQTRCTIMTHLIAARSGWVHCQLLCASVGGLLCCGIHSAGSHRFRKRELQRRVMHGTGQLKRLATRAALVGVHLLCIRGTCN